MVENIFLTKELYQSLLTPVCIRHKLTHTEMLVLLFLANNPDYDTASDIVARRRLTKSAVSMAVKNLYARGFITGEYADDDHRLVHLKVCGTAEKIVEDGRVAQGVFYSILMKDFSEEELETLGGYFSRVAENITEYHKKERETQRQKQHTQ